MVNETIINIVWIQLTSAGPGDTRVLVQREEIDVIRENYTHPGSTIHMKSGHSVSVVDSYDTVMELMRKAARA